MPLNHQRLKEPTVLIRAGILDGILGKVPFEHSVNFYNRCCSELGHAARQFSEAEQLATQTASAKQYPRHTTIFSKSANNIDLMLFYGHHEFLAETAMKDLAQSLGQSIKSNTTPTGELQQ